MQYTATVTTPQLPEDREEESKPAQASENETPEQAFARRQEELAEAESRDADSFLNRETKPWVHKSHLTAETRPNLKQQRFPSRDIWEDTPDSLQLETTVASPQVDDKDILSPSSISVGEQEKTTTGMIPSGKSNVVKDIGVPSMPQVPVRPTKSKLSSSPEKAHPEIPERPAKRSQNAETTSPLVPAKSKPVVPARPSKPISRESSDNVPLSKAISNASIKSTESDQTASIAAKPKPPVPTRPIGSKIAALQGGFMSDLNKRLQLGPQAPKKEEVALEEPEVEKDKAPLVDARKGRARGPARRAPAKSPTPTIQAPVEKFTSCGISTPSTLWEIDPEKNSLHVASVKEEASIETKATQSETPTLATNTAGDNLHHPSEIATGAATSASPPSATEDARAHEAEEAQKDSIISAPAHEESEPVKESDEPRVKSQNTLIPEQDEEEELAGSTSTLKPDVEDLVE